jgi:hypothetical protein
VLVTLFRVLKSLRGDLLRALAADDLNVAVRAQEWVDSSMGTISASSSLLGLVDLNVPNDEVINIQTLHISIGFAVLE